MQQTFRFEFFFRVFESESVSVLVKLQTENQKLKYFLKTEQ